MGISDKVNQFFGSVQTGAKNTSVSLFSIFLKVVTAFLIGLTVAMIGQELMSFGTFAFLFVLIVTSGIITKILSKWSISSVLIFDLICVLVALLLRMYILVAP